MLQIADTSFTSRLFTGSGKFAGPDVMSRAISASKSELVTLAMKRINPHQAVDPTLAALRQLPVTLLPNTSGARTADEAIYAARLARELLGTDWVKLEIHPDQRYLLPDPIETLQAAQALVKEGFIVLPYCGADPVLCKRLEEAGCHAVMPLGAPIGSNRGLLTRDFIAIIVEQSTVPVVVDAGIGKPSDAASAMEMGVDAVLVNSAIASSSHPVLMASAFAQAVQAGRAAYEAGPGATTGVSTGAAPAAGSGTPTAQLTSPLTSFLESL